jgi:L-2-aminoadipate reductase
MLKACTQLASRPDISNTVNMVPVDHVARVVVACALHPPAQMSVAHVTGHPRLTFNQFLASLSTYGYDVPITDYKEWTGTVQNYVDSTLKAGRDQLAV